MADVNITITVPDAWVSRTLTALNGMADKRISIHFENAMRHYQFEPKAAEETNIQFAKRAFTDMIKYHIKAQELNEDYERFVSESNSITQPSEDVPEDIIT